MLQEVRISYLSRAGPSVALRQHHSNLHTHRKRVGDKTGDYLGWCRMHEHIGLSD